MQGTALLLVVIAIGIAMTLDAKSTVGKLDGKASIRERVRYWAGVNVLDPALVWGVVMKESSANPFAENPGDPSSGLMGVTPLIGRAFGGLSGDDEDVLNQLKDVDRNLRAGTGFLSHLQSRFSSSFPMSVWVQAYNLGETLFSKGRRNPAYGASVMKFMGQWRG